MRRAARRDANEPEIVSALLAAGADVQQADFVDLVVGYRGATYLLEVKQPHGTLRASQRRLLAEWRGHYAVVRSADDALRAIGAIGSGQEAGC